MVKFSEKTKRSGEIINIPVNDIRPNPYQPRKSFRWEDLEELAQSIYQNGLLQPVTVRDTGGGKYELVAGERRLRASKMAGLAAIPAIVVDISEEKSAVYAVVENLQRQDLHFFEEAQAIEKLARNFGMDRDRIAKKLGKSPSAVSNKLRLLKLPEEIREKIISAGLTERHARAMLRLPTYALMDEAVNAVAQNRLNVSETELLISRLLEEEAPQAKEEKQPAANVPAPVKIYRKPTLDCLAHADNSRAMNYDQELKLNAQKLEDTLTSFGVRTKLVDICRGPSVTRYELQPAPGVKISKITGLSDDIALALAASGVRIEAPIPNKSAVGIEIPNKNRATVSLREIVETAQYKTQVEKSKLSVALGKDITGETIIADLAKMPHLLIAGTTGSGKSVCLNAMIISILFNFLSVKLS